MDREVLVYVDLDGALAAVDIGARKALATTEFVMGERLIAQGKIEEGAERFRAASTLDGENPAYGVALAQATLADGRPRQAEQMLLPLLERDQADGPANLAMARVMVSAAAVAVAAGVASVRSPVKTVRATLHRELKTPTTTKIEKPLQQTAIGLTMMLQ